VGNLVTLGKWERKSRKTPDHKGGGKTNVADGNLSGFIKCGVKMGNANKLIKNKDFKWERRSRLN